jgi:protein arginine kinase activator
MPGFFFRGRVKVKERELNMIFGKDIRPYCEGCKNKPTIHVVEIVDGKSVELHLCENCHMLKELNLINPFDVKDLLMGLLGNSSSVTDQKQEVADTQCQRCHLTFKEFLRKGLLGCPECYKAFKDSLTVLLKNYHGSDVYKGKVPNEIHDVEAQVSKPVTESGGLVNRIEKLLNLKEELKEAVEKEDYEYAAQLRDKLNEMENKNQDVSSEKGDGL